MAEDKSKSNSQAGDENKNQNQQESGKEKENSQNQNVDVEKLLKENEGLKQAQSTLTKTVEELKKKLDEDSGFKSKLAQAFGMGDNGDKKPGTEELLQKALEEIDNLKKGNRKAEAQKLLNKVISELSDEGKEVDSKVKEFLRGELDADEPDEEKIKEVVNKKYTSIKNLLGGKINLASDKSPNQKATAGNFSKNPNANEILEAQGLKININRR